MINRPTEIGRHRDENLKETLPNTDYDRLITAEKCGMFQ